MKKCVFFVLIMCFLFVGPSFATDLGRSFGLGGAFIGVADDPSAIFYNPAGLSQIKRPEIGASEGLDYYSSSTKYNIGFPEFKSNAKDAKGIMFLDFFGATYPFLSAANPLVAGLAFGGDYDLNIHEAGDLPALAAPYDKLDSTMVEKTESKAIGIGYNIVQGLSLGLSLLSSDNIKSFAGVTINEPGVVSSITYLGFDTSTNNRISALLGGLYKFDERASIGAVINVPGDAIRRATAIEPINHPYYLQYSYLEKLPTVIGIGASYRPLPALLLALDVRSTPALTYKSKVQTDLFGDGAKDKIKSDAYTEIHAGCEYTFDLGGGAGIPLRIGYASIPVHSNMNAWDVYSVDPVIGIDAGTCSTKTGKSVVAVGSGYEKDNLSVDLGIQSISEDTTIRVGPSLSVKNKATVLRGLLSCGLSF